MRRARAIDEKGFGNDHPDVGQDCNNLAALLQAVNRFGEAEPLMRHALTTWETSVGNDHPNFAICLSNLARQLQAANRPDEAEPLLRRALVIFLAFQRNNGHAHPHRDMSVRNYAGLLAAVGKSEAEIAAELAVLHREAGLEPG